MWDTNLCIILSFIGHQGRYFSFSIVIWYRWYAWCCPPKKWGKLFADYSTFSLIWLTNYPLSCTRILVSGFPSTAVILIDYEILFYLSNKRLILFIITNQPNLLKNVDLNISEIVIFAHLLLVNLFSDSNIDPWPN